MSTYIVYGSRYGASKTCAEHISKHCDAKIISVTEAFALKEATCIIIGSSVYAGMLRKDIKKFLVKKESMLLKIPVYFFISGLSKGDIAKVMQENVSSALTQHIKHTYFVGGILNFPKMSCIERGLIALINKKGHFVEKVKKNEVVNLLDYEALDALCEDVTSETL